MSPVCFGNSIWVGSIQGNPAEDPLLRKKLSKNKATDSKAKLTKICQNNTLCTVGYY